MAVGVDCLQVIVVVDVEVWFMAAGRFGVQQAHLVVVCIADGGHALALGRTGAVEFEIDAKRFAGMGQLGYAGDAVVADIAAHVVGGVGEGEVDVRLQRTDMLGLQDRAY